MVVYKPFRFILFIQKRFILVLLVSLLYAPYVAAEQLLSLEEAVEIALEQGYDMKSLKLSLIQAEENQQAAKRRFRTNADMRLSTPSWGENVREVQVPNALPIYNSLGTLRYQGLMNINQPLPTDGTVTLRSRLYQSKESNFFSETDQTLKRRDFLTSLSINLNQPLLTYNRLQSSLKTAELNYERSFSTLNRTKLDVIYDVTNSFFSLYRFTRGLEIARETMEQKKQQYDTARLKFEAGLIPEVEALRMEVDLATAQSGVLEAEANLERQKEDFKRLIGLDLSEDIGVKTDIVFTHFDIDLDTAIRYGMTNRSEIREQEIEIDLDRISLKETEAEKEISANLSAYYDFTGRSDPNLAYSTATGDLFDSSWDDLERRPGNRGVTLTFDIPIWDWGVNKAEVESARTNLLRSELQLEEERKMILNSITDAVRRVRTAESSLNVNQKNQDVAERMYEISSERFNNGEITSEVLAQDNDRLSSAKMAYLGAYISYKLAVADIKRKTLYDFEIDSPLQ